MCRIRTLPTALMGRVATVGSALWLAVAAGHSADLPVLRQPAGLAVTIGIADAASLAELSAAGAGRLLVQACVSDEATASGLRRELAQRGLSGLVSVWALPGDKTLPQAERLADLVIAADASISAAELERIAAPYGAIHTKAGTWSARSVALPAGMDHWPQWDYDAGGNPCSKDIHVRPTIGMAWYAGPSGNGSSHDTSVSFRIDRGMAVHVGWRHFAAKNREETSELVGRGAFNGLRRYALPLRGEPAKFTVQMGAGRVWAPLTDTGTMSVIDASTGAIVHTLPQDFDPAKDPSAGTTSTVFVRLAEHLAIISHGPGVAAFDAASGSPAWTWKPAAGEVAGFVVADRGVVAIGVGKALAQLRGSPAFPLTRIVALKLADGAPVWDYAGCAGKTVVRMVAHAGTLYLPFTSQSSGFGGNYTATALDIATGKERWSNPGGKGMSGGGHYQVPLVQGDRLVIGNEDGFALSAADGTLLPVRLRWGQVDVGCADLRATPSWTMYGLTFVDRDGKMTNRGQTRSSCDVGMVPAYGMMFTTPVGCLCNTYISGNWALHATPVPAPLDDAKRLIVTDAKPLTAPAAWPAADEWPLHRGDPRRGCFTPGAGPEKPAIAWTTPIAAALPSGPIAEDWAWHEQAPGTVSAPTSAGGLVYVAEVHGAAVVALNASDGKERWRYRVAARVTTPPTLYAGAVFFGSRDGWITSLDAATGALRWRFFAAPAQRLIVDQGQVESAWPAHGSVLISKGVLIASAGRHTALDGGLHFYGLDPSSGALRWKAPCGDDLAAKLKSTRGNSGVGDAITARRMHSLVVEDVNGGLHHETDTFVGDALKGGTWKRYDKVGNWAKYPDVAFLRTGTNGFTSRRIGDIGRGSWTWTAYAEVIGAAQAIAGRELFSLRGNGLAPPNDHGLFAIAADATLVTRPDAKGRPEPALQRPLPAVPNAVAIAIAGERIYVACGSQTGTASAKDGLLIVLARSDAKELHRLALPAVPIRDGLAIAGGMVFVSLDNGSVAALR